MTKEKQAREETRAGWSRRGRTTNCGQRREGAAEEAAHARAYSSPSLERNILSLCLLRQQIPKEKSPPSLNADSRRAQSTAATSQSPAQAADVDGVDPKVSIQMFTPMWLPTAKFLAIHCTCFERQGNYTSRSYAKSTLKDYRLKQQTARKYHHLVVCTQINYQEIVNMSQSRTWITWSK